MPRTRNIVNDAVVLIETKPRKDTARIDSSVENLVTADEPVLQDITEQFLAPESTIYHRSRPKRKPKVPTRGRKLSSSLPPSSPPSTSSHTFDFETNVAAEPEDDPFGFLAAEKKLKARREESQARRVLADVMMGTGIHEEVDGNERAFDPVEESTPNPLLTPKKRNKKRKSVASPTGTALYTPNTSSAPSSPSPVKPILGPLEGVGAAIDKSADGARRRGKGKKMAADVEDVSPRELARNLEALLPKRPMRRRGRIVLEEKKVRGKKAKVIEVNSSEVDEDEEKKVRRPRGRAVSKPQSKGKSKAKAGEELDLDEDKSDKWARDRQERLEYFRKLEGYTMEKENVYVI